MNECYYDIPPEAILVVSGLVPVLDRLAVLKQRREGSFFLLLDIDTLALEQKMAFFFRASSQHLLPVTDFPPLRVRSKSARRLILVPQPLANHILTHPIPSQQEEIEFHCSQLALECAQPNLR